MKLKNSILIALVLLVLLGLVSGFYVLGGRQDNPPYTMTKAALREIRVVVSTNGIIEPAERSEVYAPLDGFVASIPKKEGSEILRGQVLVQLNSEQIRSALTEANAALLAAKPQALIVETGAPKEELAELDASIAESAMQLDQTGKDLAAEKSLLDKKATTQLAVDSLQKQRDLLQLRVDALKQKKRNRQARYSAEEKEWERARVAELVKRVESLKNQLTAESVPAPQTGLIYSLQVKQGSFVNKGQLLAQIYQPGRVRLRAYVDEPDLGRIRKGQPIRIEWDGLPNQQWAGLVEKPAEQVVAMNNRSVGEVLCSIGAGPTGLIPNLNVRVQITTELKQNALVVPRTAVYSHKGKPSVLTVSGTAAVAKPVQLGLVTPEEIEIVQGLKDGDAVVLNPADTGVR
jgi:HlyD family secretion protein